MIDLRTAVSAVAALAAKGGVAIAPSDEVLLGAETGTPSPQERARFRQIVNAAGTGFFKAAAEGLALAELAGIKARFGRTLEENYPEAGTAFLRFARTYWSLKLIVDEPVLAQTTSGAMTFLFQLERSVGPSFFPAFGPVLIDPAVREADQRRVLRECGAPIDVLGVGARSDRDWPMTGAAAVQGRCLLFVGRFA